MCRAVHGGDYNAMTYMKNYLSNHGCKNTDGFAFNRWWCW